MTPTNYFTFTLPIPPEYLRDWKGPQPDVYICYSLDRRGVVEVKWFTMHPDVSTIVTDWEGLKLMMREAAEGNAEYQKEQFKGRLAPGYHRPPLPQPGEDPWFDAQMELNWK